MLPHGGTLIFTGATMAIRELDAGGAPVLMAGGGASFSVSAPSAFAKRGLSQSLAREFGPKGIHVAHVVIDGLINTERVKGMMGDEKEEGTVRLFQALRECLMIAHKCRDCSLPISQRYAGNTSRNPFQLIAGLSSSHRPAEFGMDTRDRHQVSRLCSIGRSAHAATGR